MPRGRKLASLTLTDEQQNQLQGMAQSATLPYALVVRARIILASAEGLTNAAVAKRVGVIPHTVGKWRRRFREAGVQGLHDEMRPGRPRTYDDDKVASVINRALQEKPDTATHWTTRALGQAEGLSKSTVQHDREPRIDLADALAHRRRQGVRRTGRPYRERSRAQRKLTGGAEHRRRGGASQVVVASVPNDPDDLDLVPLLRLESEPPAYCIVDPEQLGRGSGVDHCR